MKKDGIQTRKRKQKNSSSNSSSNMGNQANDVNIINPKSAKYAKNSSSSSSGRKSSKLNTSQSGSMPSIASINQSSVNIPNSMGSIGLLSTGVNEGNIYLKNHDNNDNMHQQRALIVQNNEGFNTNHYDSDVMLPINNYQYQTHHQMNEDHLIQLEQMKQANLMGQHQQQMIEQQDSNGLVFFNSNRQIIYQQNQQQQEMQLNNTNNLNNQQSSMNEIKPNIYKLSNGIEFNPYNKTESLNRTLSMNDSINYNETKLNHLTMENNPNQYSGDEDDDESRSSSSTTSSKSARSHNGSANPHKKIDQTVLNNDFNSETVIANSKIEMKEEETINNSKVETDNSGSDYKFEPKHNVEDDEDENAESRRAELESTDESNTETMSVYRKFKMNESQILNLNKTNETKCKQQPEQSDVEEKANQITDIIPSSVVAID